MILFFLDSISILVFILLAVAFFTLVERKLLASVQRRLGPNSVGLLGLLQAIADGFKLIIKETVLPSVANPILFYIAPLFFLALGLLGWALIPFGPGLVIIDMPLGMLATFTISSLSVYCIILAGWSSNSRYAFLGGLRSAAQMISYEISFTLLLLPLVLLTNTLNLTEIVLVQTTGWLVFPLFPIYICFLISALAETNRPPFDLPEAEGELVAGYNVEYSAVAFALFFIAEYANILLMSSLAVIFFMGGWLTPFNINFIPPPLMFSLKVYFHVYLFVIIRSAYPRYRYDQLMYIGWLHLLSLALGSVVVYSTLLLLFF